MLKHIVLPVAVITGLILSLFIGCTNREADKIPITTNSKKALKYYLRGRDLNENLRGQESRPYFEKAIAEDPDFALAYLNLALVQPNNRDFLETFKKARALAANVSPGEQLMIYAIDAAIAGYQMQQRKLYTDLTLAYPNDERAHYLLGNHYYAQQEFELAVKQYYKAIIINTEFAPSYNQLGYAQRNLGELGKAKTALMKYTQLIPNDPNPLDSYAELLLKSGKFYNSIEYYQRALELNPEFVSSHIGIATNLNLLDRHAEAREQLRRLYDIAHNEGERRAAHFATALSYLDEGRIDSALTELEQQYALAEQAGDINSMAGDLNLVGHILLESGDASMALEKYQQALELVDASELPISLKENIRRIFLYNSCRVNIARRDLDSAQVLADQFRIRARIIENPNLIKLCHELAPWRWPKTIMRQPALNCTRPISRTPISCIIWGRPTPAGEMPIKPKNTCKWPGNSMA